MNLIRPFHLDYLILGQHILGNESDGSPASSHPTEDELLSAGEIFRLLSSGGAAGLGEHPDAIALFRAFSGAKGKIRLDSVQTAPEIFASLSSGRKNGRTPSGHSSADEFYRSLLPKKKKGSPPVPEHPSASEYFWMFTPQKKANVELLSPSGIPSARSLYSAFAGDSSKRQHLPDSPSLH